LAPDGRPREDRLSPLAELTKTRLREFFREPGMIFWVFGFPLVMAIGLGLAFRSRPPDKPRVAVVAAGSELARALVADDSLAAVELPVDAAQRGLARARYDLLVELTGEQPVYRYDPQLPAARLARALTDAAVQRAAGRVEALRPVDEPSSAPGTRYIDFLIPGLIAMNVMGSSLWSIGYNLVVARKRKLLRRYAVTAMRRSHFLLSYFLARGVFLSIELVVLVAFGVLAFGTHVQGSLLALLVACGLGATAFAGLGMLVGSRVESTEVAQGWMNFVQLPMWVLSGIFFSNETFPDWLMPFIRLLPLTALADALRLVYNEGAGLMDAASQLYVLIGWSVLGFGLSLRGFRWQ
jgi:ABC-type multidrug transport system permease subunit